MVTKLSESKEELRKLPPDLQDQLIDLDQLSKHKLEDTNIRSDSEEVSLWLNSKLLDLLQDLLKPLVLLLITEDTDLTKWKRKTSKD